MFLESLTNSNEKRGWIEVVCGSMFSGKTEELIRRLKRAEFAQQSVEIFKPAIDTRYDDDDVVSHNDTTIRSTPVTSSRNILLLGDGIEVIGIDEAQFFDEGLVEVCNQLANNGVRVIVSGLDMDFLGKPFGIMPQLLAIAEHITKVHAICIDCCAIANHSFRMTDDKNLIKIGEKEEYKPLCRECFSRKIIY